MMNNSMRPIFFVAVFLVLLVTIFTYGRPIWVPVYHKIVGKQTVEDVLKKYGAAARSRLKPFFKTNRVTYPPKEITMLAIKDQSLLELWAETETGPKLVRSYSIKALSGTLGPKLKEGDRQVPEGLYKIVGLNPNSAYHLSLKLNYPNEFDQKHAAEENRLNPGSNIFIHGKEVSIGCLAMGDTAIEELFVLAADVGKSNMTVAIAPHDPRIESLSVNIPPAWRMTLYKNLNQFFQKYQYSIHPS